VSLIIDVFRDIVEKGAELHFAHKFLHFVSKIPFYTSIIILVSRWIDFWFLGLCTISFYQFLV
jgi:hypothetical protein